MARRRTSELLISATLRTRTGLHVGGLGDDPDVDLTLACDGAGRYLIPGTSLAGSLRHWCTRAWGDELAEQLWGSSSTESDEAEASRIVVEDAPVAAVAERRDGVGIDRRTGAAANAIKFVRGVLPRGTDIPLHLTVDLASDRERRLTAVDALLRALAQGRIRFGGAKSRGLGRLELVDGSLQVRERSFSGWEATFAALRGTSPALERGDEPAGASAEASTSGAGWLRFTVHWRPTGPLLVRAAADGIAVDSLPLVGAVDAQQVSLLLPGSSIKGALRSHAERILRTLSGATVDTGDGVLDFRGQLDQLPLSTLVFGRAPQGRAAPPGSATGSTAGTDEGTGRIAAFSVDDCYAELELTAAQWADVRTATLRPVERAEREGDGGDFQRERRASASPAALAGLHGALAAADLGQWSHAFHVAIDRWTAAPGEGLLFSVLEPHGVSWEPLRIDVELDRLGEDGSDEQLAGAYLVLLTLRELMAGRVPLGFGVNRGHGAVAVDLVEVDGEAPAASPLAGLVHQRFSTPADFAGLAGGDALEAAWLRVAPAPARGQEAS